MVLCGWRALLGGVGRGVVCRDFNVVRFPRKKSCSTSFTSAMHDFSDFVSTNGLIDTSLIGGKYTWSNGRKYVSKSRIDRFLYTADWEDSFVTISQKRLIRLGSDHFPIMLECDWQYFRFENMWLKVDGFVEMVKQWWDSYQFQGYLSSILARKLNALKVDLRSWNAEVFGNVKVKKTALMMELNELESEVEHMFLSMRRR